MKSTPYKRGRRFEWRCRDYLRKLDWEVIRSPQSRSPYDLIALAPGMVLLVQCKINGYLPPGEWNELFTVAKKICAVPILAERIKGNKLVWRELLGWKETKGKRTAALTDLLKICRGTVQSWPTTTDQGTPGKLTKLPTSSEPLSKGKRRRSARPFGTPAAPA